MRKNQKHSKENMYLAIERWQESGLTQTKFCTVEKLSVKVFSYWLRKYRQEEGLSVHPGEKTAESFIPLKVSAPVPQGNVCPSSGQIDISFPNGVQVSCPVGIDITQLKTLINF
jgi:hypothetical protein